MIKSVFLRIFTWWNGHTVGTGLFTRWKGEFVGTDDGGNKYYRERGGHRRWVLYNGEIEASRIPPDWHAWLHNLVDQPPSEAPLETQSWETEHVPNLTGTTMAYFPAGSLNESGQRRRTTGDYEAWSP
ncbi:MAG: NADH:ubiquinone oxidoreductase subunit NDUFA12 [Sphingomonadales bacterium]